MGCQSSQEFHSSIEHEQALLSAFPFKGYISQAEHRALTLEQLAQIDRFASDNCTEWHDRAPARLSNTSGQRLAPEIMNLYHVADWMIRPATRQMNCSFVELLAVTEQVPNWYISHWWGNLLHHLTKCLFEHTAVRLLAVESSYWICAFALRQHSLDFEVNTELMQTSFCKAIAVSRGIVLVLDQHSQAFTRIWCAFELSLLDKDESKLLDVAAVRDKETVILADGLAEYDKLAQEIRGGENSHSGNIGQPLPAWMVSFQGPYNKAKRENNFPLQIFEAGVKLRLEFGHASKEEDRRRILNHLSSRDSQALPLATHENYDAINQKLRAIFAAAIWQSGDTSLAKDKDVAEVLAAGARRNVLVLDFSDRSKNPGYQDIAYLSSALCPNLQVLDLAFVGSQALDDACIKCLSHAFPPTITKLRLDCAWCKLLTDAAVHAVAAGFPATVQDVWLSFYGCEMITDAGLPALSHLRKLSKLFLCLDGCSVTDAGVTALMRNLPNLESLHLALACSSITDVGIKAVSDYLPEVSYLFLSFGSEKQSAFLTDEGLAYLSIGLSENLKAFHLFVSGCSQLSDQGFAKLAASLPRSINTLLLVRDWPPARDTNFNSVEEFQCWASRVGQEDLSSGLKQMQLTLLGRVPDRCTVTTGAGRDRKEYHGNPKAKVSSDIDSSSYLMLIENRCSSCCSRHFDEISPSRPSRENYNLCLQ